MTRSPNTLIPADFPTVPALIALEQLAITSGAPTAAAESIGWLVFTEGEVPAGLGFSRDALTRAGFDGTLGSTLVLPQPNGAERVAVGAGSVAELTGGALRDVAAAFVRATAKRARLGLVVPGLGDLPAGEAARALVEGAALTRYRYTPLQTNATHVRLEGLSLDLAGASAADVEAAAAEGLVAARATAVARDLANTPPGHLTATDMGEIAIELGARFGFDVEIFDKAALVELGCGGLLGVNQGSAEEPRMVKLTYSPAGEPSGHLGLIGKGIMYDSGGISLKPSDPMHLLMKMDMGGAAAVLGAFTALRDLSTRATVTGWLMCTDNMPSGTAYKLGDVLTTRGGVTVEVKNTDAEGRLVMSDAFVLANEAGVDAIIDIATLTGAALMALGQARAPLFGNHDALASQVLAAAERTDEPLWRMPLERTYRKQLDSTIADISNLGGPYAGATTAALFLEHFAGDTPWAHLDIAGTMQTEADDSWRSAGATGFGARVLAETARGFVPPAAASDAA